MVKTMPRKPRFFVPGCAAHIVQRGHNRCATFFEQEDYKAYLSVLAKYANRYGCKIHAYVLMTNHVHLLATPAERDSISRMMQSLGRVYVPFINQKYVRSGTLWEGRFKACPVAHSQYVLACYRYIEMNPVRAGMVRTPGEYPWSSFQANASIASTSLLTAHADYAALGAAGGNRAQNYRQLFLQRLSDELLSDMRTCLQSGTPFGNDCFKTEIETALHLKTGQKRRGRPFGSRDKGL
jgi:putative transposase